MRTPGISAGTTRTSELLLNQPEKIFAVRARRHWLCQTFDVVGTDIAETVSDFFETGHHQALAVFDRLDVVRGLHQRFMRSGVEPGDPSAELLDRQFTAIEVVTIDVGDFELTPRGRFE